MEQTAKPSRLPRILLIVSIALFITVATVTLVWWLTRDTVNNHLTVSDNTITLSSPSGNTQFVLCVENGRLCYRVTRDDMVYIDTSPLGLSMSSVSYGEVESLDNIGTITGDIRTDVRELHGRKAVADAPCVQALFPVNGDNAFTLEARVFDDGVAFRYLLEDSGPRTLIAEETGFVLPKDSAVWAGEAHMYYESINKFYDPDRFTTTSLGTPATVKLASGGYTAIMEGDLADYPGLKLQWTAKNTYTADIGDGTAALTGAVTTPWRILSVADDLNELVNNTIVYQVCDKADESLFADDWVKPGRAAWSWITGRTTDRVTEDLMEEYTLNAAKLGFEYNIIDEGWINWGMYAPKLQKLAALGDEYGVGQILWTGVTAGASYNGGIQSAEDAYAYLDLLETLGMAGGKIDFFTTENNVELGVDLYRDILAYAAQKELVINFHGCNKPTGYDVTFRNELNREAILGLESTQVYNQQVQAQMFTTQPFVRNLAGHADFTPAVDLAFHMAQLVLTDAPMQAIGSDPADILASPAREMIKSVPTVWQETVVLPQSDIGKSAVIARKAGGGSWFVGGINNTLDADEITLDLSLFLGDGDYRCELWIDGDDGLEMTEQVVSADDTLTVPFTKENGFIVRFDRVTLSQYGGAIDPENPLTITVTDPDTTVRYTLDGSEPGWFSKTLEDSDTLTFDESCVLTLKVTTPNEQETVMQYRFNVIE